MTLSYLSKLKSSSFLRSFIYSLIYSFIHSFPFPLLAFQDLRMDTRSAPTLTIEGTLVPGMTGVYLSQATAPPTPTGTPLKTSMTTTTTPLKTKTTARTPLKTPPSKSTTPAKLRREGFEAVRVEEFALRYYKENRGFADGMFSERKRRIELMISGHRYCPYEMNKVALVKYHLYEMI